MNKFVEAVKGAVEGLRTAQQALANLDQQQAALRGEQERLQGQLSKAPLESLAVAADGNKVADRATSGLLAASEDIRLKLTLVPAIRLRFQAQAQGQTQLIHRAVNALMGHCAALAEARAEREQSEVANFLLKYREGDGETAQVAATRALQAGAATDRIGPYMPASKTLRSLDDFRHFSHASDPLEDAEAALGLADRFVGGDSP